MKRRLTIKKNYEFKRILKSGKWASGIVVSVHFKKNNITENRVGISVSKKLGNSVQRNKVKRWIREILKTIKPLEGRGFNIVLIIKNKTKFSDISYNFIKSEIISLFDRIIKKES